MQSQERLLRLCRFLVLTYSITACYLVGEWTGLLDTVDETSLIAENAVPYYTIICLFGAAGSGILYAGEKKIGVYFLGASILGLLLTNLYFPMKVPLVMWALGLAILALLIYLIWRFWDTLG